MAPPILSVPVASPNTLGELAQMTKICPPDRPGVALRVGVSIRPVAGRTALDARGQSLHCVWAFTPQRNDSSFAYVDELTKNTGGALHIEADQGSFCMPVGANLAFTGGNAGSEWEVLATVVEIEWPDPFEWKLTTTAPGAGAVLRPTGHQWIRLVSGVLTVNGIAIAASDRQISLSEPSIIANAGTIYETGGRL